MTGRTIGCALLLLGGRNRRGPQVEGRECTPRARLGPQPADAPRLVRAGPRLDSLPARTETTALDVLAVLGRGSPRWTAVVRDWAPGDAADRARAARAIRHHWQDPIWRELVPELLDAGLSEQAVTDLRQGLLPINDATDATGFSNRLAALQPLLDDTLPVVRQFAAEPTRACAY
jgi:hypothetical protein